MDSTRTILNDGKAVTFVDVDESMITAIVSINDSGVQSLEYQLKCRQCGAGNWVAVGTDSGEYRCMKCMEWL
jgi:succinate dehydrogenase/fumarate reductase-like Fe-S protein